MTSEVVVMNRIGVALAADSAVTIDMGGGSRVRDSALKLFMLSKHRPVGVMVYNNAQLLGVPLETIIKLFRRDLGRQGYDTLGEYGDKLIHFLDGNTTLFPDAVQTKYFLEVLGAEFRRIDSQVRNEIADRGLFGEAETNNVVEEVIERHLDFWRRQKNAEYFHDVSAEAVVGQISGEVHKIVEQAVLRWGVGSSVVDNLYKIARHLVDKDYFPPGVLSGLVIAGFGEAEHFPAVMDVQIGGVYGGRLKVRPVSLVQVTNEKPSEIRAFAYTDMADAFLYGIPLKVLSHLEDATTFIREMPPLALDAVVDFLPAGKVVADKVRKESQMQAKEFADKVLQGVSDRYQKILHAVETLTIRELAQVASTLVGLSSFEQQMLLEQQTVGGPVDVAVISKGDGFIWIDRKHYFRRELNEHFFHKCYGDVSATDGPAADEEGQNGA